MSDFDVDLFVIGGGSGGVRAARIAAQHGARVMLAEEYRLGGTCVIRGCVPKKLLVYASRFHGEFEDAAGFGWTVPHATFDWTTLIANKDKEIARLETVYGTLLEKSGVKVFKNRATLADAHTVQVANGDRVRAAHVLISTGGTPSFGDKIPGIEHAISSNEAFHLPELPRRVVIQGGGYIAVEFAGIFAGLGSQVTLVYRGENILRGFDDEVRQHLRMDMEKHGIRVVTGCTIAAIEQPRRALFGASLQRQSHSRRQGDVRHRPRAERRQARAERGRRRDREERRHRRRRIFAHHGAKHLRRRRCDQPDQPDAGRDPRGPCLRRHRVRRQAHHRRPRQCADRGVLRARGRRRRPHRGRGAGDSCSKPTSTKRCSGRSRRRCRAATPRCW